MVTLQDSLVSSSARRMTIRKRPDLTAQRQTYLGKSYWVVKDPIGLNYFRFQDEEYGILQKIDGDTSLDELKEWFEATFPPQKITLEELQQFIGMLHRSGLVIANVHGQGKQLLKRRDERRKKEMLGAVTNILCIKFKGIDPERLLNWLYPKVRILFSLPVFILSIIWILSALTLVTVQFDTFYSKLPDFQNFFNPTNGLWLMVVLGVTTVLHEFGHGLTCKHFKGECHEMGFMLLVLTPCLYCNVSDSWMLPNKWKRAAIGAAGMYVEVVLAAAATFIWWFTQPGMLNMICLNIIFMSSVKTIMFNANPLLRYDGYYILADLAEIPNLRQKATTILSRKAAHWFLGIEPPDDPFLPQKNQIFFAIYSVAAGIYRWFVLLSILWFLHQFWKPYRLQIFGYAIIGMSLISLVGMPIYKVTKFFYVPGRMQKVKKLRFYLSLAGLAGIIAFILYVPLPHSVSCALEVRVQDADHVYVTVPGLLEEVYVQPGKPVEEGDPLAKLKNVEMDMQMTKLVGEQKQYEIELNTLEQARYYDAKV
ncbi:MAG: hemolysin D, partial [Planctomycetia bacterium]